MTTLNWTETSFDQLGLISDPHIIFQKPMKGWNDYKGPENKNHTLVSFWMRRLHSSNGMQAFSGNYFFTIGGNISSDEERVPLPADISK